MKKATIIGIILIAVILTLIVFFGVFFNVNSITVRYENDVTVTTKEEILQSIAIDSNTNIFSVNEKKIKEGVEKSFSSNAIEVTSVVRSFPSNVTVVVRERTPIYCIRLASSDAEKYVVTDKDFYRYSVYSPDNLVGKDFISVSGFTVTNSFVVEGCYKLKEIASFFISKGFSEDALTSFIDEVTFDDNDKIVITLFDGATFTVEKNNVGAELDAAYGSYLSSTYMQRAGKTF